VQKNILRIPLIMIAFLLLGFNQAVAKHYDVEVGKVALTRAKTIQDIDVRFLLSENQAPIIRVSYDPTKDCGANENFFCKRHVEDFELPLLTYDEPNIVYDGTVCARSFFGVIVNVNCNVQTILKKGEILLLDEDGDEFQKNKIKLCSSYLKSAPQIGKKLFFHHF
jgi:hypothetical protein